MIVLLLCACCAAPAGADTLTEVGIFTALAAGTDNLAVTVIVGGKSFSATVEIDISPAPQVLTSIQIASTVN